MPANRALDFQNRLPIAKLGSQVLSGSRISSSDFLELQTQRVTSLTGSVQISIRPGPQISPTLPSGACRELLAHAAKKHTSNAKHPVRKTFMQADIFKIATGPFADSPGLYSC